MLQECHQEALYLPPPLHLPHSQQAATDPRRQRQKKKKKTAKLEKGKKQWCENSGVEGRPASSACGLCTSTRLHIQKGLSLVQYSVQS